MNRITILLIFLIVISMVLPTSAIMYASGQSTDNSDDSSTGGSTTTDNSGSSTTTDNSGSSSIGGSSTTTDNSGSSSIGGGTTTTTTTIDNSATLPTISTASNNSGKAYCDTCNNDIYKGGGDLKSMVLTVHNNERSAVGVPPLVWSDDLAAGAKTWANHLATTGQFVHDPVHTGLTCTGPCYGENLAGRHGSFPTTIPIAQEMQGWIAEKNVFQGLPSATGDNVVGHYTQMVWKSTSQIGCATATGNSYDVLVCRYTPPGNVIGQKPY